jgi:hypothetical protein
LLQDLVSGVSNSNVPTSHLETIRRAGGGAALLADALGSSVSMKGTVVRSEDARV